MDTSAASCWIGMGVLGLSLLGCGRSAEVTTEETRQAVYVDSKTMQAMVCDIVADPPAVNPKTGQRTLMPALYCSSCRVWHAVPPPDQINRVPRAAACLKTGATLTADGPWPE